MTHNRYDVFLSHASPDKPRVRELAAALAAEGLTVFLDEQQRRVGDSLYSTLNESLDTSDFFVFCVSRASVDSGWVDREIGGALAMQVKTRRKRILPVRLDDVAMPSLLADLVCLDMSKSSHSEVAADVRSAIASARASEPRGTTYPSGIAAQVEEALNKLAGERAARGFCWAIISGPSSVGKDVLSYVVLKNLGATHGLTFLTKLTTRPRRPSEPEYVQHLNDAQFQERWRDGDILFPFRKRNCRYGFDAKQFREALREGTPIISVFTEFGLVPAVVDSMNNSGIRTRAFRVEVPKADALRRILFRNLSPDEVTSRISSIEQDYATMADRPTLTDEYTVVPNGDSTAFTAASQSLTEAIKKLIEESGRLDTA